MSITDLETALTSRLASTGDLAALRGRARAAAAAELLRASAAAAAPPPPPPPPEVKVALDLVLDFIRFHGWYHAAAVLEAEAGALPCAPPRVAVAAAAGLRTPPADGLPLLYALLSEHER